MTAHFSDMAPDTLPHINYLTVDDVQAAFVSEAMALELNQARFDVAFIPIDTPDARRVAAEEWADYKQALGDVEARERGAAAVFSTRDESAEALEALLENRVLSSLRSFGVHALLKVTLKADDANTYELLRAYYEPTT